MVVYYSGAWRFAKKGGTVEKKSRVPSLTEEGSRNSVKGGVLPFFVRFKFRGGPRPLGPNGPGATGILWYQYGGRAAFGWDRSLSIIPRSPAPITAQINWTTSSVKSINDTGVLVFVAIRELIRLFCWTGRIIHWRTVPRRTHGTAECQASRRPWSSALLPSVFRTKKTQFCHISALRIDR